MFIHNYKYSLKLLLKSRTLVFWTLAFPLIMSVLFNMAFSNIESSENFNIIDIAVVENENDENNSLFMEVLENLGDSSSDDQIFNISYTDEEEAQEMLINGEISGYISFDENKSGEGYQDEKPKVTVMSNGINQTILKYVVDEIESDINMTFDIGIQRIIKDVMKNVKSGNIEDIPGYNDGGNYEYYEKIFRDIAEEISNESVNLRDDSSSNLSYVMIEYYSLIAMSCLYSGMFSMTLVNFKLANMCTVGKRSSMSPVKKGSMLFGSLAAGYTVQLFGLLALFLFTIFVLKVNYGTNLPMIIVLSLLGSLAGLSLGVAIGALVKKGEGTKVTILISITMAGCYLAGMMGISAKYLVDKNVPVLNMINPVAMITDGLYTLYYYNTLERFYFDAVSLVIFSALMMLISWSSLRRQKYDSL